MSQYALAKKIKRHGIMLRSTKRKGTTCTRRATTRQQLANITEPSCL
jgi:hypothetical protein